MRRRKPCLLPRVAMLQWWNPDHQWSRWAGCRNRAVVQVSVRLFLPYVGCDRSEACLTSSKGSIDLPTRPACLSRTGLSIAFSARGKLLTVAFKSTPLGATEATSETTLAAHRCSHFL